MDPATAPTAAAVPPSPAQSVTTAWTRPAQLTAACFLVLSVALIGVQIYRSSRWACKPLEQSGLPAYQIDLNRAGRAELLQLPGVGPQLADRIVQYRQEQGPFRSVNDLQRVHGIGPATVERLRGWVCVTSDEAANANLQAAPSPVPDSSPRNTGDAAAGGAKAAALATPIDINRADLAELQKLPGIGPKIAQRILDVREKKPFQSLEDLRRVPGIGPKTLERLRPFVIVKRHDYSNDEDHRPR